VRSPALIATLWLATLVLAWMLGANWGDNATPQARSGGPAPSIAAFPSAAPDSSDTPPPPPRAAESGSRPAAAPPRARARKPSKQPVTFEPREAGSLEELSERFMEFADQKLGAGEEGHLELFRLLDGMMQNKELIEQFVKGRDEEEFMPLAYPWIKFLVHRDKQVVSMMETLYRTAAENPAWFEGLDDDSFEMFTEGVAVLLPGAVDAETMARFQDYVNRILALPKESLPKALRKNLSELGRNLEWWAGPINSDEALAQVRDRSIPLAQRIKLLPRVDPKDLGGIDLVALLEPAIRDGDRNAVSALSGLPLTGGDIAVLDSAFITAMYHGAYRSWMLRNYLIGTGRRKWADARALVENGLRHGGQATRAFALGLAWMPENPDKGFVVHVLETYELPAATVGMLKDRYEIK